MNTTAIGLIAMILMILTASVAGYYIKAGKTIRTVICGITSAVLLGVAGYCLTRHVSIPVASWMRDGGSIQAISMFSEMNGDLSSNEKVLVKIGGSYQILELPPVQNFDAKLGAYKVPAELTHRAGLVKVEKFGTDYGPDWFFVSFTPEGKYPQSRWRITGKN